MWWPCLWRLSGEIVLRSLMFNTVYQCAVCLTWLTISITIICCDATENLAENWSKITLKKKNLKKE